MHSHFIAVKFRKLLLSRFRISNEVDLLKINKKINVGKYLKCKDYMNYVFNQLYRFVFTDVVVKESQVGKHAFQGIFQGTVSLLLSE